MLDHFTLHQMLEVVEDHARDQADMELRFMAAIRVAVPAALDATARAAFEKREQALNASINS